MITLFIAFFLKHYICDYPLQRWPYMYNNKGTYGHSGGLLHAYVQGTGTVVVLLTLGYSELALALAILDASIHYHVDYAKMKLGNIYNLKPDNSEWYWHLLGLDQLLHYLTYALIIWILS